MNAPSIRQLRNVSRTELRLPPQPHYALRAVAAKNDRSVYAEARVTTPGGLRGCAVVGHQSGDEARTQLPGQTPAGRLSGSSVKDTMHVQRVPKPRLSHGRR